MSKKRWFFLWLLFIGYLFLGASIFYNIERDLEERQRREKQKEHKKLQVILKEHVSVQRNASLLIDERERSIDLLFDRLSDYCARPLQLTGENSTQAEPYKWTFYNSFFFALTTLSTIGYGNLSPNSEHGKVWVILYSLIGIPFNGIVLTHLGEFFGSKFLRAHHRYKTHTYESRISLIADILVYLTPGILVFIIGPSFVFQYTEKWTFIDSVYFSFVSLTTIGFGDFVAGQTLGDSPYEITYKVFLVLWVMFGLGYLVMILGFISRALRSKKINKLEKKVAQTLKHTQSKIWNEFVSDVHYLQRILNELYLMKVRPVYKEKTLHKNQLSYSCPNLSEWPVLRRRSQQLAAEWEAEEGGVKRRRALSENAGLPPHLQRVLSDGALHGIDMQATFAGPGLLDATGGIFIPSGFGPGSPVESDSEDYKEGGMNMFSDEEILASEGELRGSRTSVAPCPPPPTDSWYLGGRPLRRRGRAMSEAHVLEPPHPEQKTWAGADSLHHYALLKAMRAKSMTIDEEKGFKEKEIETPAKGLRRLSMAAINFLSPTNKIKKMKPKLDAMRGSEDKDHSALRQSAKHRLSLQEEESDAHNQELNYLTEIHGNADARRSSLFDIITRGRSMEAPISPVLEQTSIADFIRAVQSLRALEAGGGPGAAGVGLGLLSPPGSPPPTSARERGRSVTSLGALPPHFRSKLMDRRFSQIPNGLGREAGVGRPRAASIAPVLMAPVDRRLRRLSTTPRPSPFSSGRATPVGGGRPHGPLPPLVVTSPDGRHKFTIQSVEPSERLNRLHKEFPSRRQ